MRAFAVFTGETDIQWLRRFLKPGFRHCFVMLNDGKHWISLDPLANRTELKVHDNVDEDCDLPGWMRSEGAIVVEAKPTSANMRCAPLRPFTCVEAVKRVLGIHARMIFTPWQLYRFLEKQKQR